MQKWLDEGYKQFAHCGPDNLSIKKMGEAINYSRASFYYHFGDLEVFKEQLLKMHWDIAGQFQKEGQKKCKNLFPDLYDILASYPIPLKFNLQLFKNRHIPAYNYTFNKLYEASAKSFLLRLFAKEYQLKNTENELFNLWITVGEAWYSRLDEQDLTSVTLQKHAKDILSSVIKFANSQFYSSLK
jgi:AcrR family transcriptional regulator